MEENFIKFTGLEFHCFGYFDDYYRQQQRDSLRHYSLDSLVVAVAGRYSGAEQLALLAPFLEHFGLRGNHARNDVHRKSYIRICLVGWCFSISGIWKWHSIVIKIHLKWSSFAG